jgi:hypothetical protein
MKEMSFPPSLSYWEIKEYFMDVDLLVVGSGIVGLTTAIFYKEKNPGSKILIVERGMLPLGASTKNAGFACFGSPSEILADLKKGDLEQVYKTIEARIDGLKELRSLVGDKALRLELSGGFELFRSEDEAYDHCLSNIQALNREFASRFGQSDAFRTFDELIPAFGFKGVKHLIGNLAEGAIDTGSMMRTLLNMVNQKGVAVLNGLQVVSFENRSEKVEVSFTNGMTFKCGHMHVATNGFATMLLPELNVNPARAQVLITEPIAGLKVRGTFHLNEGYYYFRNLDDRILLGGGRQLNFDGETTTDIQLTEQIQADLNAHLRQMILPDTDFKIAHRWAGIMGVGESKQPILKRISPNVSCSVRLGGMGVAIGTTLGRKAADLIG